RGVVVQWEGDKARSLSAGRTARWRSLLNSLRPWPNDRSLTRPSNTAMTGGLPDLVSILPSAQTHRLEWSKERPKLGQTPVARAYSGLLEENSSDELHKIHLPFGKQPLGCIVNRGLLTSRGNSHGSQTGKLICMSNGIQAACARRQMASRHSLLLDPASLPLFRAAQAADETE